jgi:ribosomal protein L27
MGFNATQMASASAIMQTGGMVTSALGSYNSAAISKINLDTQANLADINARIAERGAQSALLRGQKQVGALTLKAGQLKSRQRVSLAANGVDLGVGNAAELQASTDIMAEIDKNTIEANSVMEAWGYRTNAVNYQNDALMKRASASALSPGMSAASSLLGSAGSVASAWGNYYKLKE